MKNRSQKQPQLFKKCVYNVARLENYALVVLGWDTKEKTTNRTNRANPFVRIRVIRRFFSYFSDR